MLGLTYLNNRHYDPTTGVFVSVDPLVTQTMQPYIYGAANPVTYSDPNGLCPFAGCWEAFDAFLRGYQESARVGNSSEQASVDGSRRASWYAGESSTLAEPVACPGGCHSSSSGGWPLSAVWDRVSTYAQVQAQANWRRLKNPGQTMWDLASGTIFIEEGSAFEAIMVENGELLNEGAYCGTEMECITGVTVMPGQGALTTGHLVRFSGTNPGVNLIAHEAQHVYDIETVGGAVFYGTYVAGGWPIWERRGDHVQGNYPVVEPRGLGGTLWNRFR